MNSESLQNGMVRTYKIVPTSLNQRTRTINAITSIPATGIFEKVKSVKPTSHSKFATKCGKVRCSDCHFRGTNDEVSGMRLVTWRVVDTRLGLGVSFGFGKPSSSGSEILKRLDEGNDVVEELRELDAEDEFGIEEEEWMDGGDGNGDDDETMSFCEVDYVWEQVDKDDDSWCLVAEM